MVGVRWSKLLKYSLAFGVSVHRNGLKLVLNMVKRTQISVLFP